MDRFLAGLFLVCAIFANQLGHFWFTYGIWPRSWWSFTGFALLALLNLHLSNTLMKSLREQ